MCIRDRACSVLVLLLLLSVDSLLLYFYRSCATDLKAVLRVRCVLVAELPVIRSKNICSRGQPGRYNRPSATIIFACCFSWMLNWPTARSFFGRSSRFASVPGTDMIHYRIPWYSILILIVQSLLGLPVLAATRFCNTSHP